MTDDNAFCYAEPKPPAQLKVVQSDSGLNIAGNARGLAILMEMCRAAIIEGVYNVTTDIQLLSSRSNYVTVNITS